MHSDVNVGSTFTFMILGLRDRTHDHCFSVNNQQNHCWDCCRHTSFRSPLLLLLCLSLLPSYLQHLVLDAALVPKVSTWHTGILCSFLDLDALHVVIVAIVTCRVAVVDIRIQVWLIGIILRGLLLMSEGGKHQSYNRCCMLGGILSFPWVGRTWLTLGTMSVIKNQRNRTHHHYIHRFFLHLYRPGSGSLALLLASVL